MAYNVYRKEQSKKLNAAVGPHGFLW